MSRHVYIFKMKIMRIRSGAINYTYYLFKKMKERWK